MVGCSAPAAPALHVLRGSQCGPRPHHPDATEAQDLRRAGSAARQALLVLLGPSGVLNLTWDQFDKLKNLPWCALEGMVRLRQSLGSDLGFSANSTQWNAIADRMNRGGLIAEWRPGVGAYGSDPVVTQQQTDPGLGDDSEDSDHGNG